MRTIGRMAAALALAALLLCGATGLTQESELAAHALDVYASLAAGEYGQLAAQLDGTMAAHLDEAGLRSAMESVLREMGAMTGAAIAQTDEAQRVAVLLVGHEGGQALLQVAFDGEWRISGLYIQPISQTEREQPLARELPEGAQARRVALFAGTARELAGEIVIPAGADGATVYVVFAHGSGPSDMDGSVGANKPLRDLAYDLAALGVGSLRFDKITYAAPQWPIETVDQEYLEPIAQALDVLREQTRAGRVYLVGHSEGGMLAPYLVERCGFDGGVALAGTPRQLWEISAEQNLAMIALMPKAQRETLAAQVEEQTRLAETLADMTDEETENTTVFGMSAVYLRHMARMDQVKIARDCGKPFLFLWGDADAQVSRGAFEEWAARLGDGPFAYIVYPGLNHLFIPAREGENVMNVMEAYGVPSRVDEAVARGIADWIAAQR